MNKDYLKEILNLSKNLKSDIILIIDKYIYGVDKEFNHLKEMYFENPYNIILCFPYKDVSKLLKKESVILTDKYIKTDNDIIYFNKSIYISKILKMKQRIQVFKSNPIAYFNDDIKNDIEFKNILNLKTKNGSTMYKINNEYILFLYKGLLPINKKDNVSLSIYDIDKMFLANFNIKKSKNIIINQYLLYLKIY